MIHQKLIDSLSGQFSQLLAGRPDLPGQQELQSQVRSMLQGTFAKLDLVTRDEFEAQQVVLMRTRDKLEQLEQRLAALEPSVENPTPAATDNDTQL